MSSYDPNMFKNTWQENCYLIAGYVMIPIVIALIIVVILTKLGAYDG